MLKRLFAAALVACALPAIAPARAQEANWPQHPIKLVVAAAAGGPIDVFARVISDRMAQLLGQGVVIENVAGAGGMVGGQRVARAEPDGYSVLLGTIATNVHSQNLYKKPLYDANVDFTPVVLLAEFPLVLIARKDMPASSLKDFVAYAKANAGKMNYGSAGVGSATHLGCALLTAAMGVNIQHVPYRGTGPAMQDLQAGRIDFLCEIILSAQPQIEAKTVKAIALLGDERAAVLPDLPTAKESGFTNMQAYSWAGLFLPKGAAPNIVAKLRDAAIATIETPEVRAKLAAQGATIVAPGRRTPDYLASFVRDEIVKWAAPVRASGIEPQ